MIKLNRSVFIGLLWICSCGGIHAAELQLFGQLTQGAMIVGKVASGSNVQLDGQKLDVTKKGYFVFGFGRDAKQQHQLVIAENNGNIVTRNLKISKRNYKIQSITGIPKKIMQPSAKALARIKKDNEQVYLARQINSSITAFAQKFIKPASGTITGVYGSQRIFNGVPKRPHFGLDFAGKIGTPVVAPADGKVTMWVPDMFYSGGTLIIDHGHKINSTFLHLSQSYVKVGDVVKQGQKIAAIGTSGRATGPHLDWRVNWGNVRLDPVLVLKVFN